MFRFEPSDDWPFLLASIRDEELARPAAKAGKWWPEYPGVMGGRDLRAGGTWLALDVPARTVAAIFTPGGPSTKAEGKRSRGDLPLIAVGAGSLASVDVDAYLPFTLLLASATSATWWSWDGSKLEWTSIAAGMHAANNEGLDDLRNSPRQARWLPRFSATAPVPFRADGDLSTRWRGWLDLLDRGLEPERGDSLLISHRGPHGQYGTKSVALLAISDRALRYDVSDQPGDPASWRSVDTGAAAAPIR